jgi:hypothetical protein
MSMKNAYRSSISRAMTIRSSIFMNQVSDRDYLSTI